MVLVRFKKKFKIRGRPVKAGDLVELKPNDARALIAWGLAEHPPPPEPKPVVVARRRPAPKPEPVPEPEPEKAKEPEPEPEKTEEAEPVEPPASRRRYRRADMDAED